MKKSEFIHTVKSLGLLIIAGACVLIEILKLTIDSTDKGCADIFLLWSSFLKSSQGINPFIYSEGC